MGVEGRGRIEVTMVKNIEEEESRRLRSEQCLRTNRITSLLCSTMMIACWIFTTSTVVVVSSKMTTTTTTTTPAFIGGGNRRVVDRSMKTSQMRSHTRSIRPLSSGLLLPSSRLLSPALQERLFRTNALYAVVGADEIWRDDDEEDDEDDNNEESNLVPEDDEDEEDEYAELESTLGDWRAFRQSLTRGGISSITEYHEEGSMDEDDSGSADANERRKQSLPPPPTTTASRNNKIYSFSPSSLSTSKFQAKNSVSSNSSSTTTTSSMWAHVIGQPEVGGLVVRMPLEIQLNHLRQQAADASSNAFFASSEEEKANERQRSSSVVSSASPLGRKFLQKYQAHDVAKRRTPSLATWYDRAQKFMEEQMHSLAELGTDDDDDGMNDDLLESSGIFGPSILSSSSGDKDSDGKTPHQPQSIDISQLEPHNIELLQLYVEAHAHWQEVCLVIDQNTLPLSEDDEEETDEDKNGGGYTTIEQQQPQLAALTLNRPMATSMSKQLAQLVVFGAGSILSDITAAQSSAGLFSLKKNQPMSTMDALKEVVLVENFVKAFGDECGVYIGGNDAQHEAALILHPHGEIAGAQEIAPQTGIYIGGHLPDICRGVLDGTYKALDFKFFIGRHEFQVEEEDEEMSIDDFFNSDSIETDDVEVDPGALPLKTSGSLELACLMGTYQPVACSSQIAIKQCINLSTPLWHEVLQLCGGEMEEISQLEEDKKLHFANDPSSGGITVIEVKGDDEEEDDDEDDDFDGWEEVTMEDDDDDDEEEADADSSSSNSSFWGDDFGNAFQ